MELHDWICGHFFRCFFQEAHRKEIGVFLIVNPSECVCDVWIIWLLLACGLCMRQRYVEISTLLDHQPCKIIRCRSKLGVCLEYRLKTDHGFVILLLAF